MSLAGKVCVVTGGGRGIGEAIGRRFRAEGATVAVWDVDSKVAAEAAAALDGSAHACDVSSRHAVEAAATATLDAPRPHRRAREQRRRRHRRPVGDVHRRDWDTSIGIMQTGVFLCSQAVGRHMLERGSGVIVNISSINAWEAFPMRLAYCAAKAAVVAMTEVLAIEWADRGVRVNAVAPGVTRTALVQRGIDEGVIDVEAYRNRTPMHRFGEPDEIARAVTYLADDDQSAFVTGTTLRVDGGWSAQGWIV